MNKKILLIILIIVILALLGGGYYFWKIKTQKPTVQQAVEDIQKTAASISADIGKSVSPDVTTPVVNLPNTNANPYNKTNPYSNLKTNPFE